MFTEVCL